MRSPDLALVMGDKSSGKTSIPDSWREPVMRGLREIISSCLKKNGEENYTAAAAKIAAANSPKGLSRTALYDIMTGATKSPSVEVAEMIAVTLGIPLEKLVFGFSRSEVEALRTQNEVLTREVQRLDGELAPIRERAALAAKDVETLTAKLEELKAASLTQKSLPTQTLRLRGERGAGHVESGCGGSTSPARKRHTRQ